MAHSRCAYDCCRDVQPSEAVARRRGPIDRAHGVGEAHTFSQAKSVEKFNFFYVFLKKQSNRLNCLSTNSILYPHTYPPLLESFPGCIKPIRLLTSHDNIEK